MTSILTNTGAMVALQTLKGVNKDLGQVQEQISTGKKVGTAKDNAAVWAISKTMESDVTGFKKISEGLAVAQSTVAVARDASETVTDLLTQMKDKIVQAQGDSVDDDSRTKLQADVVALREQVESVVGAAQFNGVNLVNGSTASPMNVLSSLDRSIEGAVKASNIGVKTVNMSTEEATDLSAFAATGNAVIGDGTDVIAATEITAAAFLNEDASAADGTKALTRAEMSENPTGADTGLIAGDVVKLVLGDNADGNVKGVDYIEAEYTVAAGDNGNDVSAGIAAAIQTALDDSPALAMGTGGNIAADEVVVSVNMTTGSLSIGNIDDTDTLAYSLDATRNEGKLSQLGDLDVSTKADAETALENIEGMIQTSIDAAAAFGTVQNQLETQSEFVGKLTDNLKAGIGAMVDADMEAASARLQALQTQQQLGIQSLSIANQAPQSVLSLFR
ncbi:flagellin [Palleronia marisminoris]|uniref:Flagellin n=1 Tax=Palleronia marisminoris TaxID=315423 RepID=A0A1Y5SUM4_9RHOB|nr:flagellin [Palleronia marisminoris]SFG95252.1 flagellin [Palleronia marisminoris]SLN46868.1 Flagellin [Palleronia marisminoris]